MKKKIKLLGGNRRKRKKEEKKEKKKSKKDKKKKDEVDDDEYEGSGCEELEDMFEAVLDRKLKLDHPGQGQGYSSNPLVGGRSVD